MLLYTAVSAVLTLLLMVYHAILELLTGASGLLKNAPLEEHCRDCLVQVFSCSICAYGSLGNHLVQNFLENIFLFVQKKHDVLLLNNKNSHVPVTWHAPCSPPSWRAIVLLLVSFLTLQGSPDAWLYLLGTCGRAALGLLVASECLCSAC
jgi:hypothetical protein